MAGLSEADRLAQACVDQMWDNDKASRNLGMEVVAVSEGKAVVAMVVRDDMVNGYDICHGGMIFSVADSAFAFACNSQNHMTVAASCAIDFVRPAHKGDRITATTTVIHQGSRSGIYDVVVTNQNEKVIAQFRGRSSRLKGPVIQEDIV